MNFFNIDLTNLKKITKALLEAKWWSITAILCFIPRWGLIHRKRVNYRRNEVKFTPPPHQLNADLISEQPC